MAAARAGLFKDCPVLPPTAIFHLTTRFKADPHPKKLNLGVGAYRDEALKPVVFSAVRKAEAAVIAQHNDKEYLPVTGLPAFTSAAATLLFGADSRPLLEKRIASCQTLSGTGALTLTALLIRRLFSGRPVYCSDPTWENHARVVADAGLGALLSYRYWDAESRSLDFAGLCEDLRAMPEGSIVLLHGCAHNPTGCDPTHEQWGAIADIVEERRLVPWFDIAYQGFASGDLDADAWALRMFVSRGLDLMVDQSFAKNMGLYSERIGALHVVTSDTASGAAVLSVLENIARPLYSNPPAHGARIVALVLSSAELAAVCLSREWGLLRSRMCVDHLHPYGALQRMRVLLRAALVARGTPGSWDHIIKQIGMFSYTGLTEAQSTRMVEEFHVYMLPSGRINIAGLSEATIDIAADAIHAVVAGSSAPGPVL